MSDTGNYNNIEMFTTTLVSLLLVGVAFGQYSYINLFSNTTTGYDYCNTTEQGCELNCLNGTYPPGGYTCNNSKGVLEVYPSTHTIFKTMKENSLLASAMTINYIYDNQIDLNGGKLTWTYSVTPKFGSLDTIASVLRTGIINSVKNQGYNINDNRILVTPLDGKYLTITFILPKTLSIFIDSPILGDFQALTVVVYQLNGLNESKTEDILTVNTLYSSPRITVSFIELLSEAPNGDLTLYPRSCRFAQNVANDVNNQTVIDETGFAPDYSTIYSEDSDCVIYQGAPGSNPQPYTPGSDTPGSDTPGSDDAEPANNNNGNTGFVVGVTWSLVFFLISMLF